jgi:hypothetical protein
MPLGYYLYSTGRETDDTEVVAVHFRHVVEQHPDVADVALDVGCYALRGDRILLGPTKWVVYGPVEREELDRRMESGEIAEILKGCPRNDSAYSEASKLYRVVLPYRGVVVAGVPPFLHNGFREGVGLAAAVVCSFALVVFVSSSHRKGGAIV